MSDMLMPLPQVDGSFEPYDGLGEAVGGASPEQSPAPEGLPRPSDTAVIHGEERRAAAGGVLSSNNSFSSGNESSPGGFHKRHSESTFQSHVDKKSLHGPKVVGHSVHQSSSSNPMFRAWRGIRRGGFSSGVGQPRFGGFGRGVHRGSQDPVVSTVISRGGGHSHVRGRGRGIVNSTVRTTIGQLSSANSTSNDTSVDRQPELDTHVNGALSGMCRASHASGVDPRLMGNNAAISRQFKTPQTGLSRCPNRQNSGNPSDDGEFLSPAEEHRCCLPLPRHFSSVEPSRNDNTLTLDVGRSQSDDMSSGSIAAPAHIGNDSLLRASDVSIETLNPTQHNSSLLRPHGARLELLFEEQPAVFDDDADTRSPADTDVELTQSEPSARCVQLSHSCVCSDMPVGPVVVVMVHCSLETSLRIVL